MLRRISGFATGRRSKWIVVAVWVLFALALGPLQPKLQEATTNEPDEFLPASADSTEVNDLVESRFARGNEAEAIILVRREGGLNPSDRELISAEVQELAASSELEEVGEPISPFGASEPSGSGGAAGSGAE